MLRGGFLAHNQARAKADKTHDDNTGTLSLLKDLLPIISAVQLFFSCFVMKLSLITSALLLAGYAVAAPFHNPSATLAPLYTPTESDIVPESYIVVLKDHVKEQSIMEHCGWVNSLHDNNPIAASLLDPTVAAGIKHTFNLPNASGYTGRFSDRTLERIRQSSDVSMVIGLLPWAFFPQ
jgi:hypothetical protein